MNLDSPRFGYDLDGTLFELDLDEDVYCPCGATHPSRGAPLEERIERVARIHRRLSIPPIYVTGRCLCLHERTLEQIAVHELPRGHLFSFPGGEWDRDQLESWKAGVLLGAAVDVHVGDLELDRRAADRAGCAYVDADALDLDGGELAIWTLDELDEVRT